MLLTSWYREARHTQDSSLQQRIIQSQMSVVLRLRNPVPGQHAFSFIPSREDRIYVPEFPGVGKRKSNGNSLISHGRFSKDIFSVL